MCITAWCLLAYFHVSVAVAKDPSLIKCDKLQFYI
ncbi:hypothetical protein GLYMA_13G047150v4 [Glycine max]|nr:hypothetical protein GLYMA_13G047150v4 [Glycine max]KAH1099866.1 hypothetical protein GYH30_035151 [Glycine max]